MPGASTLAETCKILLERILLACDSSAVNQTTAFNQTPPAMTRNQFLSLCLAYCIAPGIALENENIRAALAARDAEAVEFALANEF